MLDFHQIIFLLPIDLFYEYAKTCFKFVDWENTFQRHVAGQCIELVSFIVPKWCDMCLYSILWLIRVWFLDCHASDDSFARFIDALKVNTTLIEIRLCGTLNCFICLCYHYDYHFFFSICLIENYFGNDGAKYIADVLKVNTTFTSIEISCQCFCFEKKILYFKIFFANKQTITFDAMAPHNLRKCWKWTQRCVQWN